MAMRKKIVALLKQLQTRVKEFINMLLAVLKGKSVVEAKRASALSQNKGKIILGMLGALTIAFTNHLYKLGAYYTFGATQNIIRHKEYYIRSGQLSEKDIEDTKLYNPLGFNEVPHKIKEGFKVFTRPYKNSYLSGYGRIENEASVSG